MIDLSKSRYDTDTYLGRLRHFSELTDPRSLLASDSDLKSAQSLIKNYRGGLLVPEEQLWAAKKLVDACIHPDTGEAILLPFRMCCFVPTNVPIIAAMLLPNPSLVSIVFWQWMNQSVNVAFNYANANKTTQMSNTETGLAYFAAVGSSCGIAVGLSQWLKRLKVSPFLGSILGRAVPFTAVAAAGTLNVFLMRQKELTDGIQVVDENGKVMGSSQMAGQMAIQQVAISRITTAAPALFLPGLLMSRLESSFLLKKYPRLSLPISLGLISTCLLVALPCAIALFPQTAKVSVYDLEPRFHQLGVSHLYFNRGL